MYIDKEDIPKTSFLLPSLITLLIRNDIELPIVDLTPISRLFIQDQDILRETQSLLPHLNFQFN